MPSTQNQLTLCLNDGDSKPIGTINNGRLTVREDMTQPEWVQALRGLKTLKSQFHFIMSDLVQWGTLKWGKDEVHSYLAQLEFDMPDVKIALDIASVPKVVRDLDLEPEQLVALKRANVAGKEMLRWGQKAKEQNLSGAQLKASIPAGEVVDPSVVKQQNSGIYTVDGFVGTFLIWFRRMGELEGISKRDPETRDHILKVLAPVEELIQSLKQWKKQDKEAAK